MAASPVVVFQALDQQPAADLVAEIKKQEGFQRALFGRKLEDPDTGVLYTGSLLPPSRSLSSFCSAQNGNRKPEC